MEEFKSIKNWASEDRPREKLVQKGVDSLSNSELLAILINTGMANRSALDIAKEILEKANQNLLELNKFSLSDIRKIKGMGEKKAVTLIAALELGKRRQLSAALDKPSVTSARDLFELFDPYFIDKHVEQFCVIFMNPHQKVVAIEHVSQGGLTSTIVDVRIIFKRALELPNVTKIAVAHNHPSGSVSPSEHDKKITQKIREAGKILEIILLDHIIVGQNCFYSFVNEKEL